MYFWLIFSNKKNHFERIPVSVKNNDHLFCMTSELLEPDELYLFLRSGVTQTDDHECLENLETVSELIVCTKEQLHIMSIYFDIKRYWYSKNISYDVNIDYVLSQSCRTPDFYLADLSKLQTIYK